VFPLKPKGKEPLTDDPKRESRCPPHEHGLKDATTDLATIDAWWSMHPTANVALRTGDVFDVLDLDGPEAVEKFRIFCDEHSIDPATIRKAVAKTSKGWHYFFNASGCGNRARMLGAPIDWRGKGGYVVAAPSIHPSGALYRWVVNLAGGLPDVPQALRDVLEPAAAVPLRPTLVRTTFGEGEHDAYFKKAFEAELERVKAAQTGERNVTVFNAMCNVIELVNSGLDATAVDDVYDAGRSLGLDERELDRTMQSAWSKAGSNVRELPAPRQQPSRSQVALRAPSSEPVTVPVALPGQALRPAPSVYQGLLGEAVRELEPWTEADPVGVLASLLAGCGCAIGRSPHATVATTRHPLLVWPLLLGRTSTGRKGTAHDVAESLLKVAEPAFIASNITGGLSSGEGLIFAVRDPVFEHSNDPAKEPKIIDPGVEDKRRWIVESEFGGTMARAKREGSSLSAVLRQAWDGKTLATLTKTSVIATGAHIAISGHITPREFLMRLRDSDLVGGTYNRFLPLLISRSKMLPDAPNPPRELIESYGSELQRRIRQARSLTSVTRTDAATKLWHDVYYELSHVEADELDNDRLGQFIARSVPYALRLSVLYALLDGEQAVDERHVDAAASLVRYSVASVRELLRAQQDPKLTRLIEALSEAGNAGLTRTDVNGMFSGKLTAPELDDLLEQVPGLEVHKAATGGRPSQRYVMVVAQAEKGSA
jgi:hypothetical protein